MSVAAADEALWNAQFSRRCSLCSAAVSAHYCAFQDDQLTMLDVVEARENLQLATP
jgi:hypothetical protein